MLRLFLKKLKFKNASLDEALRSMVVRFRLPGEAQQMDRFVPSRAFLGPSLASLLNIVLAYLADHLSVWMRERYSATKRLSSLFRHAASPVR